MKPASPLNLCVSVRNNFRSLITCILPVYFLILSAAPSQLYAQNDSTAAFVSGICNLDDQHKNELRLGDYIKVEVNNLKALLEQHAGDTSLPVLYINEVPMTGMRAKYFDVAENTVLFKISRDDGTNMWNVFYRSPFEPVRLAETLSIGYLNTGMIRSSIKNSATMQMVFIRSGYLAFALFLIVILVLLWFFAVKRGMLKDDCVQANIKLRPFSLGRTQLAFWTILVASSFIFISLVTGELAPLSSSTLILLGVSGATTAAASVIDSNDKLSGNNRHQDSGNSEGFLTDLLSDANGISVHRFQMVVFNVILGLFFIKQVFSFLRMPDFDNNMLILLGISNVTYAGIKINENKGAASIVNPQITDTGTANMPPGNKL